MLRLGINSARVEYVWTQDPKISESIAKTTGIETIVNKLNDMIGKVDTVLLTRDDPENHVEIAKQFIYNKKMNHFVVEKSLNQ